MKERVKSAEYGRMAWMYNLVTVVISGGGNRRSQNHFLPLVRQDMSILNVGCGSVGFSAELSLRCRDVSSVDISGEMLEIAAKDSARRGRPECIRFVRADINEFAPARRYDIVFANFFLNTFDEGDYPVVLRHVMSLVAPGGLLCIADEHAGRKLATRVELALFRPVLTWMHRLLAKHPMHPIYDYSPLVLAGGFELQDRHVDRSDYICSTVYRRPAGEEVVGG